MLSYKPTLVLDASSDFVLVTWDNMTLDGMCLAIMVGEQAHLIQVCLPLVMPGLHSGWWVTRTHDVSAGLHELVVWEETRADMLACYLEVKAKSGCKRVISKELFALAGLWLDSGCALSEDETCWIGRHPLKPLPQQPPDGSWPEL